MMRRPPEASLLGKERDVPSDFIISREEGRWRVAAKSDRGKAFAADHPRFDGDQADLEPAEALAVYQKIHALGYYASVPDGLPAAGRGRIIARLALVLALVALPILIFVLLA